MHTRILFETGRDIMPKYNSNALFLIKALAHGKHFFNCTSVGVSSNEGDDDCPTFVLDETLVLLMNFG